MILLIDNYDSFVHNLARYFRRLNQETVVARNDQITVDDVRKLGPRAVVLSPGPGAPQSAGCSIDVVRQLHPTTPILGVCLGHQAIVAAFGGRIVRAGQPVHGRTSLITHRGEALFAEIPSPMTVCRYHSLVAAPGELPAALQSTALTADGVVMAIQHRSLPVFGVQFHPEALLTDHGYQILANFLRLLNIDIDVDVAALEDSERRPVPKMHAALPDRPVTF